MHDLVIRNATVIDGLGNPGREGESLAVREGRIAAIGAEVGRGAEEIDAEGRVLCPGIVDLHTHSMRSSPGTATRRRPSGSG